MEEKEMSENKQYDDRPPRKLIFVFKINDSTDQIQS